MGELMAYQNPYGINTYQEIGVKTASQGKLVVMLYEGAVNHLEKAIALVGEAFIKSVTMTYSPILCASSTK